MSNSVLCCDPSRPLDLSIRIVAWKIQKWEAFLRTTCFADWSANKSIRLYCDSTNGKKLPTALSRCTVSCLDGCRPLLFLFSKTCKGVGTSCCKYFARSSIENVESISAVYSLERSSENRRITNSNEIWQSSAFLYSPWLKWCKNFWRRTSSKSVKFTSP